LIIFQKRVAQLSERALAIFLGRARKAVRLRGDVNVLITGDREMRTLNSRFRKKDKPTDVLSFPSEFPGKGGSVGDLAISAEIAAQNARRLGHSPALEIKILVLHGVLHLAGYDHESDNGQMARREMLLRKALNLPTGLIERTESSLQSRSARSRISRGPRRRPTP
jgi:probable rRNA maturation factor